jgi:hypothetical protein
MERVTFSAQRWSGFFQNRLLQMVPIALFVLFTPVFICDC